MQTMNLEQTQYSYLDYIVDYEDRLQSLVKRLTRNDPAAFDDIWHDVVLKRVENAFNTFNPDKGSLHNHVTNTIRWYVSKWFKARSKYNAKFVSIEQLVGSQSHSNQQPEKIPDRIGLSFDGGRAAESHFSALGYDDSSAEAISNRDEVLTMLRGLSDYDQTLLYVRYGLGWTYKEMSRKLGCSETNIRKQSAAALFKAKQLADRATYHVKRRANS